MINGLKFNGSGYKDTTAFDAIDRVDREEAELNRRVGVLVGALKNVIHLAGFELVERIRVRDKATGKEFR